MDICIANYTAQEKMEIVVKYAMITSQETEKEVCVSIEGNYIKQDKKLNSILKPLLLDNISANDSRVCVGRIISY